MKSLREAGEELVAATPLRFDRFKADLERVQTTVHRALKEGRLGKSLSSDLYFNRENSLTAPLQQRYGAEGAFEPLIAYHRRRAAFELPGWPDALASAALDGMVERGRPADAILLTREHFDRRIKLLRKNIRLRHRRGPRRAMDEEMKAAIESLSQAIVDDIPAEKAEMLRDLERAEPLLREHGGQDDLEWLNSVRAEIWKERRA